MLNSLTNIKIIYLIHIEYLIYGFRINLFFFSYLLSIDIQENEFLKDLEIQFILFSIFLLFDL